MTQPLSIAIFITMRSGRPRPNPLTCVLSHDETRAFKSMVAKRGTSVNHLLKTIAQAELRTWQMSEPRSEQIPHETPLPNANGYLPKIDWERREFRETMNATIDGNRNQPDDAAMRD